MWPLLCLIGTLDAIAPVSYKALYALYKCFIFINMLPESVPYGSTIISQVSTTSRRDSNTSKQQWLFNIIEWYLIFNFLFLKCITGNISFLWIESGQVPRQYFMRFADDV